MPIKKLLQSIAKSAVEARDARIGAVGAQQVRDLYETNPELTKDLNQKYLKANATGILSAPMAGEFATYGLIGGGARLLGGTAGSTIGSLGLGALGDITDKKLKTNFLGDTGRLLGGLSGAIYLRTKAAEQNEPETYKQGGILKAQKGSFENWYKTVPKSYNDTTNYNLRRAYELAPLKELEAWKNDPQKNHLRSVYLNNTGEYEFMKSPNHPTINKELEWFNSKDAEKFRKKYYLDSTSSPWKYKLK